jgi:arylsulfatase
MTTRPNIILLSSDSLGANHLSCYGYEHKTSPTMDRLAEEGVLCERLFCPAIPTMPSYTSLYTGQHPMTHGIVSHPCDNELSQEAPFLPWILLKEGYTTCAIDSLMRTRLWFGRGYEYYIDPSLRHTLLYLASTCEELNERAIRWMGAHTDEPFFLFVHYWDAHWPFTPPKRYRNLFYNGENPTDPNNRSLDNWWSQPLGMAARATWLRTPEGLITDADYVRALYDQEIRYLDDGVNQIVEAVEKLGLAENTLILVTGDHGESMTEHGILFDHHGLYDSTIHVPLIAHWPERLPRGVRLPHMLQVTDIAPTILEAAGIPAPREMEGRSFWKLLTGEAETGGHDYVISVEATWQLKWSLRSHEYKFILSREPDVYGNPPRELYDLVTDPLEETNIVEQQPEIAAAMEAQLEKWIADRMQELGREKDPIVAHGISLGRA